MGKVKKFAQFTIKKITGGKDPVRLIEEFLTTLDCDPDEARKDESSESIRWIAEVDEGQQLEILLEGIPTPQQSTLYLGVNILEVPIRGSADILAIALEIADGLVGTKISLVGHYLVMSATLGAYEISADDLQFHFRLITSQVEWFRTTLASELDEESE